jgi:phosphohistidine phosphatase
VLLYLVRHGEAGGAATDAARPLTRDGRQQTARIANEAARRSVAIDEIRHSGRLRARETAEILAAELAPTRPIVAVDGLHPGDDVEILGYSLSEESGALMLVGHLPFMGYLTGFLLKGDSDRAPVPFSTATMACLRRRGGTWELLWVVNPEDCE